MPAQKLSLVVKVFVDLCMFYKRSYPSSSLQPSKSGNFCTIYGITPLGTIINQVIDLCFFNKD